jgi:UDPglucose 6-dehydrogenase
MKNVGIIGNGFVGSAVANGFALHANVKIYDKEPSLSVNSFEEVANCDYVFICVPTPMSLSGECDLKIMYSVIKEIKKTQRNDNAVNIIKSTVPPGTLEDLSDDYPGMNFVSNPEFLTERTANLDFINATRVVIGGSKRNTSKVVSLYRDRFPYKKIIQTDFATSQFIKYMCNCFFATKISFMNEMFQACEKLNVNWEDARHGFISDGRVGNSHLDVPGHDGKLGFGGKCFPKDINGFIAMFESIGVKPTVLRAVWEKNKEVRNSE